MWKERTLLIMLFIPWVFLISGTNQLITSQSHALMQVRKHLEYPKPLDIWEDYRVDLCKVPSSPQSTITCQGNSVTELKIKGNRLAKIRGFNGVVVPNLTLSRSFSVESFVTTLSRLSSLRVLTLVSLGIWGPLPEKIHRLSSLEELDLSSNFLFGTITPKVSTLVKLQTLNMDGNYFNDTLPDWFDSLSNLTNLSLKSNRFSGHFPSSVCRITTLTDVALSHNDLSGKLPDLSALVSLRVLDLRDNHFDSELPAMPQGLITALLSRNSFSGNIPEQFGELAQLQHLDLSFNSLSGTPPSVLFSLSNLSYLDLASNELSGSFSTNLSCGMELGFVDISGNKFVGGLPSCLRTSSGERVVKFGGNCLDTANQHKPSEMYCREIHIEGLQSRGKQIGVLAGIVGGLIIIVIVLVFGLLVLRRRYGSQGTPFPHSSLKVVQDNLPAGLSSELLANARLISQAAKLEAEGRLLFRPYSLEELKEATNNFDKASFLGEGSIGKLYKGILENGAAVAIRHISLTKKNSVRDLKLQLDLLSKLRHPHLVGLLGHCIDGGGQDDSCVNNVFLIHEYVPNGNYLAQLSEDRIGRVLKWSDRLAILIGVAKAVHFLHTGISPGCFNNRLRSSSILLDEHQIPKLSDYGMSIVIDENDKSEVKGDGRKLWEIVNSRDDVYNFGFILLETLVGPIVSGKGELFLLREMTSFGSHDGRSKIVDPVVLSSSSQDSLSIVLSITNKCVSSEPSARPSFEDVLWNLQYAAQVQAAADVDHISDMSES